MTRKVIVNRFNQGEVSPRALERHDVERLRNASTKMVNWMPGRLGNMRTRPGTLRLSRDGQRQTEEESYFIPFFAGLDNKALIEARSDGVRFWVDDEVVKRETYTGASTGLPFTEVLVGNGEEFDEKTVSFNVSEGSEVPLRITITEAPCRFHIGTTQNITEYLDARLGVGMHELLIINTSNNLTITARNLNHYQTIAKVEIAPAGEVLLPVVLSRPTYTQSFNTLYLAGDHKPYQVERRGARSWSIIETRVDDGPFGLLNAGSAVISPFKIQDFAQPLAGTLVGPLGAGIITPSGLASHNGVLYLVNVSTDSLYTVNPATGAGTLVGPLGAGITAPTGLASHNGVLYLVDVGNDSLYTVNPATFQAVGHPIPSEFISGKLGHPSAEPRKRIVAASLALYNAVVNKVKVGWYDPNTRKRDVRQLPDRLHGQAADGRTTRDYDHALTVYDGSHLTDERIIIETSAPATVISLTYEIDDEEGKRKRREERG